MNKLLNLSLLFALVLLPDVPCVAQSKKPDIKNTAGVDHFVEEMPRFEGGQTAWADFLNKNLNGKVIYKVLDADTTLPKKGFKERVVLEFIVCEDGGVCNIRVLNNQLVHPEIAEEAMRVMRLSPAWKPGKQKGEHVKVYFTQPITFASE